MTPHEPSPCCSLPLNYTFLQFYSFPLHLLLVVDVSFLARCVSVLLLLCVSLSLSPLAYLFLLILRLCLFLPRPPNMLLHVFYLY